jgi:hypothetical protein
MNAGENNPAARLNWLLVREIREKYATGDYRQEDLADEYSVGKVTVTHVLANRTWHDPAYTPISGKPRVRMTVDLAEKLRREFAGQMGTQSAFARQAGISEGLLSLILNGKRYSPPK